jgi:mycofactocin precursor
MEQSGWDAQGGRGATATVVARPAEPTRAQPPEQDAGQEVADELLVEEVSIDGMCGVY